MVARVRDRGEALQPADPGAVKVVPEVASRFTLSDRGKKYTFFLRRGLRFSDGRVTARSFA
jgi:ABC-type transport system substrate-binding protein